jgi:hypothetical protein
MRFILLPLFCLILFCTQCSDPDEPNTSVVQTLEVINSTSSSRKFRGSLEHVSETDTILAYGFEWQSRYGDWKTKKKGSLQKGMFSIRDGTPLSKWSSFTVRAFIETQNGIVYGDSKAFQTEDD